MTPSPESATSPTTPPAPPAEATSPAAPTPPRRPRNRPDGLFKGSPPPQPATTELPPEPATDPSAKDAASASGSPGDAKQPKDPGPRASSVSLTDRRQLKKAVKAGVRTIGNRLNATLTVDELERDAGLYVADEEDQEGLAEPISSLVARRGVMVANPDVADAIAALIALASYLSKQFDLKAKIRRLRKSGAAVPDEAAAMNEGAPAA